jgi:Xaa-Pro aminopeptidase
MLVDLKEEMAEYKTRRQKILDKLNPASIAILNGEKIKFRNQDTEYPFRQSSDFYYLTGFKEPDATLILIKDGKGQSEFILFCRPLKPEEEIWTGARFGTDGAKEIFGADRAFSNTELANVLPGLLEGKKQIDILPFIHELRLIKSEIEIKKMKRAAEISVKAHKILMERCKPNTMEYELEGEFLHTCIAESAREMAYPSIVAGGDNACTLHYTTNDKTLKSGDLVLVDAGCEYDYYASDITRTYPINGHYSDEQKALYELVLKSQEAAIAVVRPGVLWNKPQEVIVEILVKGLVELGILTGEVEKLIETKAYQRFYMHTSGHWLGLDVHDVGGYKIDSEWRKFQPGMVFTIEPGLYIGRNEPDVDPKWYGIGIRIEDDVLVTESGCEVLTGELPKTVADVQATLFKNSRTNHFDYLDDRKGLDDLNDLKENAG